MSLAHLAIPRRPGRNGSDRRPARRWSHNMFDEPLPPVPVELAIGCRKPCGRHASAASGAAAPVSGRVGGRELRARVVLPACRLSQPGHSWSRRGRADSISPLLRASGMRIASSSASPQAMEICAPYSFGCQTPWRAHARRGATALSILAHAAFSSRFRRATRILPTRRSPPRQVRHWAFLADPFCTPHVARSLLAIAATPNARACLIRCLPSEPARSSASPGPQERRTCHRPSARAGVRAEGAASGSQPAPSASAAAEAEVNASRARLPIVRVRSNDSTARLARACDNDCFNACSGHGECVHGFCKCSFRLDSSSTARVRSA